jgi:hypothetical protein
MISAPGPCAAELAQVDLDQIDLFDPETHATGNPHLLWAALRARAPLHRQVLDDGRAFWSVTRYQDVCSQRHRVLSASHS